MKVVVVNEGLAYPPSGGAPLRTLNLFLPLARRHELTYLCRSVKDPAAIERARAFYADHGVRMIVVGEPPVENRGLAFYGRLAANLLSPYPYAIASHRSPAVLGEIARLARTEAIDLWQFDNLSYADTLVGTSERTLVMAHNVESLIWQRYWEIEPQPLKKRYIHHQLEKYRRYEARCLRGASRVVAVSEEDAALMRQWFALGETSVVDNGVDVAHFAECVRMRAPEPRRLLFLGSLDWRPNLDAIELLLGEVFPRVLAAEPEARLDIVGRNPPAGLVRRAATLPNVEVHADVPDVRPYLARARAMVVPLRIGGGSRLKILEAAAAGVPVVSTRVGAEGLRLEAGRDIVIADEPAAMAAALVDGMRRPDEGEAMAARARVVIEGYYDWSRLADRLEQLWFEVGRGAPKAVGA